ncbi:MAG: NADH-ubiquinone oxidoreductase chain [Streptosporangiaceae bacterium]|jgi:NADH-quinone oxidoreductase subunit K|nr:NADH-ubiquinone oxidoreductase chain [Streptosporangiaceae bacterium]
MHVVYPVVTAALLFSVGIYGVLARRNAILVLMSVELMLNAVNLNLVAFDIWLRDRLHGGQALALFTIVIAAAEIGLGLAIVLLVFRNRQTIDIDTLTTLSDRDPQVGAVPSAASPSAAASPAVSSPSAAPPATSSPATSSSATSSSASAPGGGE